MTFTRSDLINSLTTETDLSRREAEHVVHLLQDSVTRSLVAGDTVSIFGFGSLRARKVPPRTIRNPATGEQMRAKKSARISFRPAPALKDLVSGAKKLPKGKLVTDVSVRHSSRGGKSKSS